MKHRAATIRGSPFTLAAMPNLDSAVASTGFPATGCPYVDTGQDIAGTND
jgi:hypothetical protein